MTELLPPPALTTIACHVDRKSPQFRHSRPGLPAGTIAGMIINQIIGVVLVVFLVSLVIWVAVRNVKRRRRTGD
jgi:hypothetical protein